MLQPEALHPVSAQAQHPESMALLMVLPVPAWWHRRDAAASRRARPARPGAHSAGVRERLKAELKVPHRREAVSVRARLRHPAQAPVLRLAAVRPVPAAEEARSVRASAQVSPSALQPEEPQREVAAVLLLGPRAVVAEQPSEGPVAEEARPSEQPVVAAAVLPSGVREAVAVRPSAQPEEGAVAEQRAAGRVAAVLPQVAAARVQL